MDEENKPVHHDEPSHEHKPIACEKEPPIPPVQAVPQEPSPKDEEWRSDQKKNWLRQLRPQWVLVFVSAGGVVAAFFTLYILNGTMEAAKDQAAAAKATAEIAKEAILASRRPWVGIEVSAAGGVEIGKVFSLSYKVKNYGATPAVNVYISSTSLLVTPGGGVDGVKAKQRSICEMGQRNPPMASIGGFTLFPGQEHIENTGHDLFSKAGVEKTLKEAPRIKDFPSIFLHPYVTGCVTYRFTFDDSVHKTPFTVQITRKPSKDSPGGLAIRTDEGPISAELLFLIGETYPDGMQPD